MPEINEIKNKDNVLAEAVDALIGEQEMNIANIEDENLTKIMETAKELHTMSKDYPGSRSAQQQAIEIKQFFRAEISETIKPEKSSWLQAFMRMPRTALSAIAAVVVILVFVAGTNLSADGGTLTATALSSGWGISLFVGLLILVSAIAYWRSKK